MSLVDLGKRLLEAAKRGDTEEVRQLMTNGAPFTTDWLGISPLHMAAQHGHLNTADVLIRAGISRDARTKVDRTPLHVAAQEGHVDIVNLLLKNGADVEAKDMLQMTPLHWAVEKSHLPVIELLLKHNADVFSLSKFDKSPIDIALDNGRIDIVQMLKSIKTEIKEKNPGISSAAGTTTIVVTTPDNVTAPTISKVNTSAPIFITTNLAAATSAHPGTLKITSDDDSSDQSSTSVLATLAALAEATASTPQSTSVSAQEALSWLESHGIAMVPADNSAVVTAAIEGGQTLSLTEAGKLALNWAKQQNNGNTEPTVETAIDGVVGNSGSEQKVITIVTDQSQLSTLTANPRAAPILTAMLADLSQGVTDKTTNGEPPNKKVCLSNSTPSSDTDDPKDKQDDFDREQLKRELEEAHRQAEDYKQQLLKTQYEAEEYKKQLDKISRKAAKAENPR